MTETSVMKLAILAIRLSSAPTHTVDWLVRTTGLSHRQVWGALRDLEGQGLATCMKSGWILADQEHFPPELQVSFKDAVPGGKS